MKVYKQDSPIFKSGLTWKIYKDIRQINVKQAEEDFKKIGADANFLNSKTICACSTLVCNILQEASEKYKLPLDSIPVSIRAYKRKTLIDSYKRSLPELNGFCISNTKSVIIDEPPFVGCSVFYNKKNIESPFLMNFIAEYEKRTNYSSSSHFLSDIMHEWFHSIHLDLIFKKYGYEGNCPVLKKKYEKENPCGLKTIEKIDNQYISPKVHKYLMNNFGLYSVLIGSILEVFAEVMTKITADALDKKLNVIKNPLDNLPKNMPKFLRNFFEETLDI